MLKINLKDNNINYKTLATQVVTPIVLSIPEIPKWSYFDTRSFLGHFSGIVRLREEEEFLLKMYAYTNLIRKANSTTCLSLQQAINTDQKRTKKDTAYSTLIAMGKLQMSVVRAALGRVLENHGRDVSGSRRDAKTIYHWADNCYCEFNDLLKAVEEGHVISTERGFPSDESWATVVFNYNDGKPKTVHVPFPTLYRWNRKF